MAYDKAQLEDAGVKLVDLILAIADGFDVSDDLPEATAFLLAAAGCVDEFTGDTDAAVFHLLGAAASHYGDSKQDPLPV